MERAEVRPDLAVVATPTVRKGRKRGIALSKTNPHFGWIHHSQRRRRHHRVPDSRRLVPARLPVHGRDHSDHGWLRRGPSAQPGGPHTNLGLVVFSVGGALYALAAIAEYVAEGHFAAGIRRRRLRRLVSKLSGHYIVCGFGRMGRGIAGELLREGHSVCVVEIDAENCEAAEEMELPVVRGDATDDASLIAAGLPPRKRPRHCARLRR